MVKALVYEAGAKLTLRFSTREKSAINLEERSPATPPARHVRGVWRRGQPPRDDPRSRAVAGHYVNRSKTRYRPLVPRRGFARASAQVVHLTFLKAGLTVCPAGIAFVHYPDPTPQPVFESQSGCHGSATTACVAVIMSKVSPAMR